MIHRFELLDERLGFVAGELAARLALGEAHRAACVSEVGVPCRLQQREQVLHLLRGCGRT